MSKLSLLILSLSLVGCGGKSSFQASKELLEIYPNASLVEELKWGCVLEFYVKTNEGSFIRVTFNDKGEMMEPYIIFPALESEAE